MKIEITREKVATFGYGFFAGVVLGILVML